ncbi:flagellar assembly protein FliW [Helicobacter mustelae]|uniref:Putative Flagellar assembly factor FliW 1 n=1 Tax=Helicobacter mustelae (strain ATCC 43772 / CCUG 25715 / CIP 103759 / LMG 18044 / NCTC 12198 / R85-136P) TaxID=679897 RepID=D3UG34_HELM1|nr:flagellar assembly protein FliW [Helicobacter mustelae]CBG39455.1 putative Flagellar assembly factor; FliW 1 [Helicobacter mustelae 12198]SQH70966.1 flagellar assembly factor; FliW [Helicobacter mustelae]STP12093.1 flagellar assembly factor; FliW [Helicobacter mustelae]
MRYILKSPILGFEHITEIELEKIDSLFAKISNQKEQFEIFLANPHALCEYSFEIPKYVELLLDLEKDSRLEVYCVMILQKDLENSLVNFLAPIVFNTENKKAAQIALSMLDYPHFSLHAPLSSFVTKSA